MVRAAAGVRVLRVAMAVPAPSVLRGMGDRLEAVHVAAMEVAQELPAGAPVGPATGATAVNVHRALGGSPLVEDRDLQGPAPGADDQMPSLVAQRLARGGTVRGEARGCLIPLSTRMSRVRSWIVRRVPSCGPCRRRMPREWPSTS